MGSKKGGDFYIHVVYCKISRINHLQCLNRSVYCSSVEARHSPLLSRLPTNLIEVKRVKSNKFHEFVVILFGMVLLGLDGLGLSKSNLRAQMSLKKKLYDIIDYVFTLDHVGGNPTRRGGCLALACCSSWPSKIWGGVFGW